MTIWRHRAQCQLYLVWRQCDNLMEVFRIVRNYLVWSGSVAPAHVRDCARGNEHQIRDLFSGKVVEIKIFILLLIKNIWNCLIFLEKLTTMSDDPNVLIILQIDIFTISNYYKFNIHYQKLCWLKDLTFPCSLTICIRSVDYL